MCEPGTYSSVVGATVVVVTSVSAVPNGFEMFSPPVTETVLQTFFGQIAVATSCASIAR